MQYNTGKGITIYIAEQLLTSPTAHYNSLGSFSENSDFWISTQTNPAGASGSANQVSVFVQNSPHVILMFIQDREPSDEGVDLGASKVKEKLWRRP